jgi:hypothetical protein
MEIDEADGRLVTGAELQRYIEGAERLTDDHAPVDQLVMPISG